MPKVNLLYVITKLELGGAQKQLLALINLLDKKQFNPFLFTCREGLLCRDASSINGLILKKSRFLERSINPLKDFLALIELYRFIKKNNIDIVHTHSSKAGILGRWAGRFAGVKTIIHTVHGWSFNDCQPWLVKRIFIWLEKISARITAKLIVVSDHDKEKGLACGIGDNDKYALIHYGIDHAFFRVGGEDARRDFGIAADDLVVGMVSCLKPQKCPQDFVKLSAMINKTTPDVKFILVGDGVLNSRIKKLISSFKLERQFIMAGWRKDIPAILRSLDIFVLTSSWEGMPISVLKAMASSRPVIVTDTGGITEVIVEDKTGFLVKTGDMDKMSEKLTNLLKNKDLRARIGHDAKDSLGQDFSLSNMAKLTQNLYTALLKSIR